MSSFGRRSCRGSWSCICTKGEKGDNGQRKSERCGRPLGRNNHSCTKAAAAHEAKAKWEWMHRCICRLDTDIVCCLSSAKDAHRMRIRAVIAGRRSVSLSHRFDERHAVARLARYRLSDHARNSVALLLETMNSFRAVLYPYILPQQCPQMPIWWWLCPAPCPSPRGKSTGTSVIASRAPSLAVLCRRPR